MKQSQYKVGMIVDHPNRPAWGPGKIVCVESGRLHVFFRDDLHRQAKQILISVVPLSIAASQTDVVLDELPDPIEDAGAWRLPANFSQGVIGEVRPPKASKPRVPKRRLAAGTTA